MSDLIKNLVVKFVHLGLYLTLILAAHFGVLNLAYDDFFAEVLVHPHLRPRLLHSVLVLSFFCVFVFLPVFPRVVRVLDEKRRLVTLSAIIVALFLFLLYGSFFQTEAIYKITASTALLAFVITLIAFCDFQKKKSLRRGLAAALLFTLPLSLYMKPDVIPHLDLHLQDTRISPVESKFKARERLISTTFNDVRLTEYYLHDRNLIYRLRKETPSHFAALDDKNFLLVGRLGGIYHLSLRRNERPEQELHIKRLSAVFPINHHELDSSPKNKDIHRAYFRVNDLHVDTEDGQRVLYVSHHFWNVEKECFTLRVSKLTGDVSILLDNESSPQWRTLYETIPCFPVFPTDDPLSFQTDNPNSKPLFVGQEAGGRIVGFDKDSLLFSVGDHGFEILRTSALLRRMGQRGFPVGDREFEMFRTGENFPQDPGVSYGKIWKIDRRTGQAELFSLGHRNPQGLYRAPDGAVWETEHGPRGGDELNRITEGDNYGWPHVLYGTKYGEKVWPPATHQNSHDGYTQPVFVWTPSIAVSNLIRVEQDLFPLWKENLLVSSLKGNLFRLQLHENRVIYSEPVKIGGRIRDLAETPNGEIFLWTDGRRMIRLRPASALPNKEETVTEVGERLFFQCLGCHGIKPNAPSGIGPNLHDVYGARIAAKEGYPYSPALRAKSAQRWTRENLSLFLKDPQAFAPGNRMYLKIPDDYEREALLDYLKDSRG